MPRLHIAAASGDIEKVKEYIAAGDDVNDMKESVTSTGETYSPEKIGAFGRQMTPLHLAAYRGHTQVTKLLIDAKAVLNTKDMWNNIPGQTALELATIKMNYGLAKILKTSGASDDSCMLDKALEIRNIKEELFNAALYEKPDVVRDIHTSGLLTKKMAEEALCHAAKYNAVGVANVLLNECDVSPDASTESSNYGPRYTALGLAAENGHDQVAELLLKKGATVDKYTAVSEFQSDCTPLREALIHIGNDKPTNPRLIELLLSYGADIKKINERGLTCLAEHGRPEEVEVLLQHGFNPNTVGKISIEHVGAEVAELSTDEGASIKKLTMHHHSVLSSVKLTRRLISEGLANFEIVDNEGKTPVRKLAESAETSGYLETLEFILNNREIKIDVNKASEVGGWTALHAAFSQNQGFINHYDEKVDDANVEKSRHTKAIDLLISHGAKPLHDKAGRTPLMCLTLNSRSRGYNYSLINRFYKFEAAYYGVDPEVYKNEIMNLYRDGFKSDRHSVLFSVTSVPAPEAIENFWRRVSEKTKRADAQPSDLNAHRPK